MKNCDVVRKGCNAKGFKFISYNEELKTKKLSRLPPPKHLGAWSFKII